MRYAPLTDRLKGLGADKWAVHYLARAKDLAGERVLFLSIGEPDWRPPEAIADTAIRQIRAGRTTYSHGQGEEAVLEAIAGHYSKRTHRSVTPANVIFMPGTQSALCGAIMALAGRGDEVIVPEPFYVTYDGIIAASGARQVAVRMSPEHRFHLTPDALDAAVTPASRVLLLNSPSNPTGAVLSAGEIAAIGEVCARHDLWIVSDEVYSTLIYGDGEFASPFDQPQLAERTVVVSSLSKSHAMTGYRAGWMVGPEKFCTLTLPFAEAMLFGCQPFIQDAAAFALTNDFPELDAARRTCERRAMRIVHAVNAMPGMRAAMPEGGMFVFADVRGTHLSGEAFAAALIEAHNVAVMPGESFGEAGGGHIRISLTAPDEVIDEALERMAGFAAMLADEEAHRYRTS